MHDFAAAQPTLMSASTSLSSITQSIKWCHPRSQFFKLNVDAACDKHNCRIGLGAIIRNEHGNLMCAAVEAMPGLIPVYAAEARAILLGLSYCQKEGYKKVEVESDYLNVINTIKGGDWTFSQEGPSFDEIKLIADQLEEVTWKKIPQQSNLVAHALAKAAIPVVRPEFWKEVRPPWLEQLILDDISS